MAIAIGTSSIMTPVFARPSNSLAKQRDRWLAHSAARFRYPPRLVLQRKQHIELQLLGITPAIWCAISTEGMVGINASDQRAWWDLLAEFDVVPRRTSTGQYYCGLCTSPDMFASRGALWVTHSFEPLLAWTNAHFQVSR
jgi:hypothetical protein